MTIGGEGSTVAELDVDGTDFDGIAGYSHSGSDPEFFDAKASVNGGEPQALTFQDRKAMLNGVSPGDTVKLILEIDPAKTDFR